MQLENLSFSYDKSNILSNINLKILSGEYLCLMGDNGSGKTTLLKILAGLSFAQEGIYQLDNVEINKEYLSQADNSKKFHQKVGYLFQNSEVQLFNNTVEDEIKYGLLQMDLDSAHVEKRVADVLKLLKIEKLRKRNSIHLSGGEKKMVAFASMLAMNPECILLDEPFNDLTRKNSALIAQLLERLHQAGKTIVLTCHEPFHVRNDITQLIILKDHQVSYKGAMLSADQIDQLI